MAEISHALDELEQHAAREVADTCLFELIEGDGVVHYTSYMLKAQGAARAVISL